MGAVDNVGTAVLGKADKETNVSISTPRMKMELAKVEPGQNGRVSLRVLTLISICFIFSNIP